MPEGNIHKNKIFIIIPCFNEVKVIRQTINPLIDKGYSVVVIDDGSEQKIEEALENSKVFYLRHFKNLGQGAALMTGMQFAVEKEAEVIVHFDADGQHNFEDIEIFVECLLNKQVDIVLGSRFLRKEDSKAIPFIKLLILKTAIIVNGLFTGLWLSDAHNGFRVMNRNAASKIKIRENRMSHATEILSLIKENKLKYHELPTHIVYTDYSKDKGQKPINSINILIDLIIRKLIK